MEADKRPLLGADETRETLFFRAIGIMVRFIMLAPALATFVLAVALLIQGLADTWQAVAGMSSGHSHHLVLTVLEIVDTFLVAMVVLVTSVGIYQLFINHRIPVPEWLRIYDIDDLKAKLIGVVITVLGVNFLGKSPCLELWGGHPSPGAVRRSRRVGADLLPRRPFPARVRTQPRSRRGGRIGGHPCPDASERRCGWWGCFRPSPEACHSRRKFLEMTLGSN